MIKAALKRLIGRNNIDRVWYLRDRIRVAVIRAANRIAGVRYINLGAGANAERVHWWTGDVQTGFVFNDSSRLPLGDGSIEFAYSSMFFEHLYDAEVGNLLKETNRVLKPGGCLRVVVPDFRKYIARYRAGDRGYFYSDTNPNFQTWKHYDVPVDMEHLLVNMISAIDNMPQVIVPYAFLEDLDAKPARVKYPFHDRLEEYYCGPAPEISTDDIKENLARPEAEFLSWVFEKTNASQYQSKEFNSWHKNEWTLEKLGKFGADAGFARIEPSSFGSYGAPLDDAIEKPGHEPIGLYFNLYKV